MALTPREQAIIQFCIAFQVTSEELREIFDQPGSERGKERVAMLEAQMDALIEAIEGLSGQRYPLLMAHGALNQHSRVANTLEDKLSCLFSFQLR
jgi:hypothetical protein